MLRISRWMILLCCLSGCTTQTVNTEPQNSEEVAISSSGLSAEATDLVMHGAAIFDSQGCVTCHGSAGEGGVWIENATDPYIPALSPTARYLRLDDGQIPSAIESLAASTASDDPMFGEEYEDYRLQIAEGGHPLVLDPAQDGPVTMPAYSAALSERQVDALLAYMFSLSL